MRVLMDIQRAPFDSLYPLPKQIKALQALSHLSQTLGRSVEIDQKCFQNIRHTYKLCDFWGRPHERYARTLKLFRCEKISHKAKDIILSDTDCARSADLHRITVTVVTYESQHCMVDLGQHLQAFAHVIVVDNASADQTVAAAQQHLPQAHIIRNARNLGFGAANNRAFAQATTEFVLLLNPDCTMTTDAALALLDAADRYPHASAIGPQLFDGNGKPEMGYRMRLDRWAARGGPAEGDLCVEFLSGACMLIRRDALQHIGGFDEDFFLYQEDHDLCLRLSKECGALVLCPSATATHLSRRSSGGANRYRAEYVRGYHHIQSKFIFSRKHEGRSISITKRWTYCIQSILEIIIRALLFDWLRMMRAVGRLMGIKNFRKNY
jgi:N-acetylglucosaminyl-diphospho-decaprenol L-rhamnosyltransferase